MNGNLNALGSLTGTGGGTVILAGHLFTAGGTINAPVRVTDAYGVSPSLTMSGGNTLNVTSGGILTLGGHTVSTARLLVDGNGIVEMLNALDSLQVSQAAIFDGSGQPNELTAGVLVVGDSLIQPGGTPASFAPTGTHKTVFNGPAGGFISIGSIGTSFFQDLEVSPTGGIVQLASNLQVNGTFLRTNSAGDFQMDSLVMIINGDALANGTISATTGGFSLGGLLHNVQGNFPGTVSIVGNRMLTGTTTTGVLDVGAGILTVNGQRLTATTLLTSGTGTLGMTNPLDTVVVSADLGFQGGDETGLLTDGAIRLAGDFLQGPTSMPTAFAPSGNSTLILEGNGVQNVFFGNPGPSASHLQNVVIANTGPAGGVTVDTAFVLGQVAFSPLLTPAQKVIYGNGAISRLILSNLNIDGATFDNLQVQTPADGSVMFTKFDNVIFQNSALDGFTQFQVTAPGGALAPVTLTFNNITFTQLNAGNTGLYIGTASRRTDWGSTWWSAARTWPMDPPSAIRPISNPPME